MKGLIEYIENERIDEGILANLLGKLGMFLVKKYGVSENASKELSKNLTKEMDSLNNEIQKISKGKIKDLTQWWQVYTKENKNAAQVKSPVVYNQSILKNTSNVGMVIKKMVDSYQKAGILNNTIVCLAIKTTVNQYIMVIESIVEDNKKKVNVASQLNGLYKVLEGIKISDNEDAEAAIKDAVKALEGKGNELIKKHK